VSRTREDSIAPGEVGGGGWGGGGGGGFFFLGGGGGGGVGGRGGAAWVVGQGVNGLPPIQTPQTFFICHLLLPSTCDRPVLAPDQSTSNREGPKSDTFREWWPDRSSHAPQCTPQDVDVREMSVRGI